MNKRIQAAVLLTLSIATSACIAGDIFDKAESAQDCLQNNRCEGHKWLGRLTAARKCQQQGNCVEKVNESIARNQDKIKSGVKKMEAANNCMNATDPEEQKKCLGNAKDVAKGYYRKREAKKEEAANTMRALASERKTQGDAVCLAGRIALGLVKARVKGFVEQINGNSMQIRIADTQGQEMSYQGVSLRQNTIIWDSYDNWIQCRYLKGG